MAEPGNPDPGSPNGPDSSNGPDSPIDLGGPDPEDAPKNAGRRRRPDLRVHDPAVMDEIELYSDLVIAAGASDRPLTDAEIDAALGVRHTG